MEKKCKTDHPTAPEVNPPLPVNTTQFDDLNDDCVRLILGKLSIHDQLRLRGTAIRWNVAVCTNLRAKRSLRLFPDFDGMCMQFQHLISLYNAQDDEHYHLNEDDPDELVGKRLNEASADALRNPNHLPALLPNLSKLVLYQRRSTREVRRSVTNVPGRLRQWQH